MIDERIKPWVSLADKYGSPLLFERGGSIAPIGLNVVTVGGVEYFMAGKEGRCLGCPDTFNKVFAACKEKLVPLEGSRLFTIGEPFDLRANFWYGETIPSEAIIKTFKQMSENADLMQKTEARVPLNLEGKFVSIADDNGPNGKFLEMLPILGSKRDLTDFVYLWDKCSWSDGKIILEGCEEKLAYFITSFIRAFNPGSLLYESRWSYDISKTPEIKIR
jgi:hypothetical protein